MDEQASKILTLDEIVAADDLETMVLPIAEWGGSVKVRALTRAQHKKAYRDGTDPKTGQIDADEVEKRIVCWATVEPTINLGQFDKLMEKNAGPIARIVEAILLLSGSDQGALDRARADFKRARG